jgi:Tannase-like family of unknown function (DUF6351)
VSATCNRDPWLLIFAMAFMAALSAPAMAQPTQFEITILSSRTYAVSGGDTLAQVSVPPSTPLSDVLVRLNGQDVTSAFRAVDAVTLQGFVTGLREGGNALAAGPRSTGQILAKILIVNHPIVGPIFSGPHQTPFICQTQNFALPITGGTAGPALDADCSIATRVDYVYMSSSGMLKPLIDPTARPADLAQTTTRDGTTVNYIVRVETGTINRAVYQIAVLHDPKIENAPDPWTKPAGWNGRLIYAFGGGCGTGHHQGQTLGIDSAVLNSPLIANLGLGQGYAIASSSLNVFGVNCDDVISAESMMMLKEHFIETFGVPVYTIGLGASGGSMQVHLVARNYPGLLDGILPGRSFPDTLTFELPYLDCDLLVHAFNSLIQQPWTLDQKAAVIGHQTFSYCSQNTIWANLVRPNVGTGALTDVFPGCDPSIPIALRYDPIVNPSGTRCTLYDDMVNVYGRDPRTGFARRPVDNVGVQYGRQAFNAGRISANQFIELNRMIGGYDVDGNYVPARTIADANALEIAYKTGRMNSGRGLDDIPIIDFRDYRDTSGNVHDAVRSLVMRARLIASNGQADNQVIVTIDPAIGDLSSAGFTSAYFARVTEMARWLDNIVSDTAPAMSTAAKVVRNKPADLVDACYTAAGVKITDPALCLELFPPSLEPRLAAGEPLTNETIKCALKALDPTDYSQTLTSAQLSDLQTIFPDGVCDYSKPGIEQQPAAGTWFAYPAPGTFFQLQ